VTFVGDVVAECGVYVDGRWCGCVGLYDRVLGEEVGRVFALFFMLIGVVGEVELVADLSLGLDGVLVQFVAVLLGGARVVLLLRVSCGTVLLLEELRRVRVTAQLHRAKLHPCPVGVELA